MRKMAGFLMMCVVAFFVAFTPFGNTRANAENLRDLSSYNEGIAVGRVLDAVTKAPVQGASVSLAMPGAGEKYANASVQTDDKGFYRLPFPLGVSKSKVSVKKLMASSMFSLATNPKGVTDQTKIIYNTILNIKISKDGYKSYAGVNQALYGDPAPFEIYMDGALLAPDNVDYQSFLASEGDSPEFEIVRADIPLYFEPDVSYDAEVAVKVPVGRASEFTVAINFSDMYGVMYTGPKYVFPLPLIKQEADGTQIYSGKVVASKKNFPREFKVIAAIADGDRRVVEKSFHTVMPLTPAEKAAAEQYEEGLKQFEAGDLAGAEESLAKAIEMEKSYKSFFAQLGVILQADGKLDEALELYQQWLQADPKNHNPNVEMMKIYIRKGNYSDALQIISKVNKLGKKDSLTEKRYLEPLASIQQIENGMGKQVDYVRAITMLVNHTRDSDYTFKMLDKAIEAYPNDATIAFLYGNALYGMKRLDDAVVKYERAVSFDAKNEEYKMALAKLYIEQDQCERAMNLIEPSVKDSKQFHIHHLAGVCNVRIGKNSAALDNFENAVRYGFSKDLMNKDAGEYIATPYLRYNGGYYYSGTLVFYQGMGKRYYSGFSFDEGKYDFSYLVSQQSLASNSSDALSLLQSGISLYNLNDYRNSLELVKKATEIDASLVQAQRYIVLNYKALGMKEEAEEALAKYKAMNPFDKEASAME